MNYRRKEKLQSAVGAGTRRTQTSPESRRVDIEMERKSATGTRSVLRSITAVNRNMAKMVIKTRAETRSETRIEKKDESKTGTRRRTGKGIEKGKKTRREIKMEKRRERGIPTENVKETRKNEETETKSGRESDTKKGKRGTKV